MALLPINAPQGQRKDTMDKIVQGLQIADGIFKIPVAWQEFNKYRNENQTIEDARQGKYTVADAAKAGLHFVPDSSPSALVPPQPGPTNLLPGPDGGVPAAGALPTPQALPPKDRFPGIGSSKGSMYGPNGTLIPGSYRSKEDEKDMIAQEGKLRDDYNKESTVALLDQTQQNFRNANKFLRMGNKEGDLAGLMNVMKLINPNVSRAQDGSVLTTGDPLFDELAKKWNWLKGGNNTILNGREERGQFLKIAADAFENYKKSLGTTNERYRGYATRGGFQPENLGIRDFTEVVDDEPAMTAPGGGARAGGSEKPSQPAFEADVLNYAKKHGITPEEAKRIKSERMGQ